MGIPTVGAYNDILGGIEIVRHHMMVQGDGRPKLYILSTREGGQWTRCQNLIREIRAYHWPPSTGQGLRERDPLDAPVAKDDHTVDALRYCIATDSRGESINTGKIKKKKREWQEKSSNRFLLNLN